MAQSFDSKQGTSDIRFFCPRFPWVWRMLWLGLLLAGILPLSNPAFPSFPQVLIPEHSQINTLHTDLHLGVYSLGEPNLQQWVHTVSASVWVLSHDNAGLLVSTMAPAPESAWTHRMCSLKYIFQFKCIGILVILFCQAITS